MFDVPRIARVFFANVVARGYYDVLKTTDPMGKTMGKSKYAAGLGRSLWESEV